MEEGKGRTRSLNRISYLDAEPGYERSLRAMSLPDISLEDHRSLTHPLCCDDSNPGFHVGECLVAKNLRRETFERLGTSASRAARHHRRDVGLVQVVNLVNSMTE